MPPTTTATDTAASTAAAGEAGTEEAGAGAGVGEGEEIADRGEILHGGDNASTTSSIAGHVRFTRLGNHGAFVVSFIAAASDAKTNMESNPLYDGLREGLLCLPLFPQWLTATQAGMNRSHTLA